MAVTLRASDIDQLLATYAQQTLEKVREDSMVERATKKPLSETTQLLIERAGLGRGRPMEVTHSELSDLIGDEADPLDEEKTEHGTRTTVRLSGQIFFHIGEALADFKRVKPGGSIPWGTEKLSEFGSVQR